MKTHTIKTPKAKLLIVEMPEGAKIRYYTLKDNDFDGVGILQHHQKPYIITGSYTLLGKPDEIREEDARELVETDEISDVEDYRHQTVFIDYKDEENSFPTAKESLLSLIETEIHWDVNPLSKPRWDEIAPLESWNDYQDAVDEWHKAEQKTFDRNRTLIFKKN